MVSANKHDFRLYRNGEGLALENQSDDRSYVFGFEELKSDRQSGENYVFTFNIGSRDKAHLLRVEVVFKRIPEETRPGRKEHIVDIADYVIFISHPATSSLESCRYY